MSPKETRKVREIAGHVLRLERKRGRFIYARSYFGEIGRRAKDVPLEKEAVFKLLSAAAEHNRIGPA